MVSPTKNTKRNTPLVPNYESSFDFHTFNNVDGCYRFSKPVKGYPYWRQGGNSLPRPMPITEKSGARWTSSFPRKHEEYWLGGLNVRTMGSNSDPTTLQNSERHQLYPDTNPLVSNMLYPWI